MRSHHFFLKFRNLSNIIEHKAVGVENISRQIGQMISPADWQGFLHSKEGDPFMAVSYKKLWKLLIDKDMKKKDLCAKAGISSASVTKMGKNGHVTTEVLVKICTALDCGIDDIMEIVGYY